MPKYKNYPLYDAVIFDDFRAMTEQVAAKYPDRVAFSFKKDPKDEETVKITFSETRDRILSLGTGMIGKGMRGKKVAIFGENSFDWICVFFALASIGAVTVPIDTALPANELCGLIEKADCSFVFFGNSAEKKIPELRAFLPDETLFIGMNGAVGDTTANDIERDGKTARESGDNSYFDYTIEPGKLSSIVFTSGTTGKSKGVMLSQTNIVSDVTLAMYNFAVTPKTMLILPLHHTFASTINLVGHYAQGCEIYISSGIRYFVREMKEQKPSHLILVPLFVETMYKKLLAGAEKQGKAEKLKKTIALSNTLLKAGIDLRKTLFKELHVAFGGNLEFIICGGAPLTQDVIDLFNGIGVTVLNGYGTTECSPLISCNRNKLQKPGTVGIPIVDETVRIADPDENGDGEIRIKGPNVMLGYYGDPKATEEVFDGDGFFRTGDVGHMDGDGWLTITGRLKNMILFSNGKNVYPEEIEEEISRIPGVCEVVVYEGISVSDPSKELIVAEIFPDEEYFAAHPAENLQAYFEAGVKGINARSVSYKAVHAVKLRTTEFERNASRKIIRSSIDRSVD